MSNAQQHDAPRLDRHEEFAIRRNGLHRRATRDQSLIAPLEMNLAEVALKYGFLDMHRPDIARTWRPLR